MKRLLILVVLCLVGIASAQTSTIGFKDRVLVQVIRDGRVIFEQETHNLKTLVGADFFAAQMGGAGGTTTARYMSVSTDATAPAVGDTTMAGELTTNGFTRATANYTYSSCGGYPCSYTLDFTWTATATVNNVQKGGVWNASSSGNVILEVAFTPQNLVNTDQLKVIWTVTQTN